MLALKYLLMILGVGLFSSSGILVAHDIYIATRLRWLLNAREQAPVIENFGGAVRARPPLRNAGQYPCGWPGPRRWRSSHEQKDKHRRA
jgi:hypothetical protein